MLEALVEEAPGNAAEDVGDAGTEQKPGERGAIGSRPDVAADLEAGQRAGQHEEEAEASTKITGSPTFATLPTRHW